MEKMKEMEEMEEMWSDLENYNHIEVPMCLKVLLWKSGYDTMLSLKYICEESITEIEKLIQKHKNKILFDDNNMHDYLYHYKRQDKFAFLPGHRSILLDLPQSIKKMQLENTLYGDGSINIMTNTSMESSKDKTSEYSVILNELINTAKRNQNKPKNAYQYDDLIKHFSTYIFLLCGRTCYETLNKNLPIPSTKTICKLFVYFKHHLYHKSIKD